MVYPSQFNLGSIPATATISSAYLNLYNAVNLHSYDVESRYTISTTYLRRVTESWDESTITWNDQPATTTTNQVSLDAPLSGSDDFTDINVTPIINDMLNEGNYGFLLRLQTEYKYRHVIFASSDYAYAADRPMLSITCTAMQKSFYQPGGRSTRLTTG